MRTVIQRFLLLFFVLNVSFHGFAQETFDGHKWEAPYHLPLPEKWTFERFLIPISFAPEIAYKGVEDIRFTSGWGKKDSEEYWSYLFLWWLDGSKPETNATIIAANLKAYYSGLMKVNIDAVKSNIPPGKLIAETAFNKTDTAAGDTETYIGIVKMLDYMTQQPITLNCIVHIAACTGQNKTVIFYELSPQAFSHSVWQSFTTLRNGFKCNK